MIDRWGREITGIRISLTQKCNLNCVYCHKEGENASTQELTAKQIERVALVGAKLGIKKIKFTGGEPLLRKDLKEIITAILPYYKDVSLTTNATVLTKKLAEDLRDAGLSRINISLDTLKRREYEKITGKDCLDDALKGIKSAKDAGLYPIKLNMVLMKGINEDEIGPMFKFAKESGLILQLIELHTSKEGSLKDFYRVYHMDLTPIEEELRQRANKVVKRSLQNRCKYFIDGGEIEVVRPMHNTQFCRNCKRIRVTSQGELKPCLLRNDNHLDLKHALSTPNDEELISLFKECCLRREPYWKEGQ
jgi:cyclic pyranopterin phosphate synthase